MDANADKHLSCQLETRHWVITDDEGTEERVDGPGVVGMLELCVCVYVCALFFLHCHPVLFLFLLQYYVHTLYMSLFYIASS